MNNYCGRRCEATDAYYNAVECYCIRLEQRLTAVGFGLGEIIVLRRKAGNICMVIIKKKKKYDNNYNKCISNAPNLCQTQA